MFSIARNILKVETKLHNISGAARGNGQRNKIADFFKYEVNCYRQFNITPHRFSDLLLVHRDSEENNTKIPFQFTEANMKRISALVQNFPKGSQRSAIAMVMDIVQRQIGWIPISAQHKVAELLSIPRMRVYEWVTFYSMCKRTYKGKFHVKVCMTLPCMLRGSEIILQAVEQATCCKAGCLSEDKMFGLDVVECQGACVNAPVMVINDDYYEDLNVCDVFNIIRTLKCGGIPPFGPQASRYAAEPLTGLTSLTECPPGPGYKMQACFAQCQRK